jgi:hypothetical protein
MHLVDANKLCRSLIKIELLLNAGNDISDNAILSDEYFKLFLEQMSVELPNARAGGKVLPL